MCEGICVSTFTSFTDSPEERSLIAYVSVPIAQSNHYMYKPYLQTPWTHEVSVNIFLLKWVIL